MKLNNRFLFGIISLALSAVIAFVAIPMTISKTNGKTEVVRVVKPILRGACITEKDIQVLEIGGYNLPSNVARTKEDVVNKYAAADLYEGDYILSSKVSFTPITSDLALSSIPSGRVAISLTVKTLASGLSDKLQPGDIIRVYHFLDTSMDVPELQFVKVLSVTDSKGVNVDNTQEPDGEEEKRQSATITVLASPEQARVITRLENDGDCHVALISRNDESLAEELLKNQDEILLLLYPPAEETEDTGQQETEMGEED